MLRRLIAGLVALALLLLPADTGTAAPAYAPLGTGFTYQGRLTQTALPVNGACDFQFGVFADAAGGAALATQAVNGVAVSDGLFTVLLDFGAGIFAGEARHLEIAVRCPAGSGGFTTLSPRQPLTAAPQSLFSASTGALRGVNVSTAAPANGQVLQFNGTQWAPASLAGATPSWLLAGNAGTNPATQFLGTTDSQPLHLRVNNLVGWRLEPGSDPCGPTCTPNVIGGFSGNNVSPNTQAATIGGGGESGNINTVTASFGTVGGGLRNTAGVAATVAGGQLNTASGGNATVGGGILNNASGTEATVAGGDGNEATEEGASIGGGSNNIASGPSSTVGGGNGNEAEGFASTVPGGEQNTAAGRFSFAAGQQAQANDQGSFVWADSNNAVFVSNPGGVVTGEDSFHVRAGGGIRLVVGTQTCTLTSAVANFQCAGASSRELKTQHAAAEPRTVLDALASMPVAVWSYLADGETVRHIGPMAEDFKAAFGMGESDTTINSLDAQGVAFAAIQGLYQIVREKEAEIGALQAENTAQQARVAELEREVAELRETKARQDALEARLSALERRQAESGR